MACPDRADIRQFEKRGSSRTWRAPRATPYFSSQLLKGPAGVEPFEGYTTVYGSFITTAPAADWLRASLKIKIPVVPGKGNCGPHWDDDTPPDSPLSFAPSGPCRSLSISRTSLPANASSEESSTDSAFPTHPPSPLVETQKLHPVLEALEKKSRVSNRSQCATCLKSGRDFPRCGRCGQMWCSRECRLQGNKRHICPSRRD